MLSSADTPKRDGRNCKHCEDPPIEGKPLLEYDLTVAEE